MQSTHTGYPLTCCYTYTGGVCWVRFRPTAAAPAACSIFNPFTTTTSTTTLTSFTRYPGCVHLGRNHPGTRRGSNITFSAEEGPTAQVIQRDLRGGKVGGPLVECSRPCLSAPPRPGRRVTTQVLTPCGAVTPSVSLASTFLYMCTLLGLATPVRTGRSDLHNYRVITFWRWLSNLLRRARCLYRTPVRRRSVTICLSVCWWCVVRAPFDHDL
jgi:hypothetical protein